MIFHKCKQPVVVKMNRSYFGTPAVTPKRIRLVTINSETESEERKTLYCQKCKEDIITEEQLVLLTGYCSYCKRIFPIAELFVPEQTGGCYCEQHRKEYYSDESYSTLLSIAKKIN